MHLVLFCSHEVVLEKLEIEDLTSGPILLDLSVTLGKFLNLSELWVLKLCYHKDHLSSQLALSPWEHRGIDIRVARLLPFGGVCEASARFTAAGPAFSISAGMCVVTADLACHCAPAPRAPAHPSTKRGPGRCVSLASGTQAALPDSSGAEAPSATVHHPKDTGFRLPSLLLGCWKVLFPRAAVRLRAASCAPLLQAKLGWAGGPRLDVFLWSRQLSGWGRLVAAGQLGGSRAVETPAERPLCLPRGYHTRGCCCYVHVVTTLASSWTCRGHPHFNVTKCVSSPTYRWSCWTPASRMVPVRSGVSGDVEI